MKSTETKSSEKKKPTPTRRATVGESSRTTDKSQSEKTEGEKPAAKRRATTWLNRSPSNASLTTAESSKEVVKVEPTSSSGFWKMPFPSTSTSSNPTPAPTTTPAAAVVPAPPVPVPAASQGEGTHAIPLALTHTL
jgi:hypothetical protein